MSCLRLTISLRLLVRRLLVLRLLRLTVSGLLRVSILTLLRILLGVTTSGILRTPRLLTLAVARRLRGSVGMVVSMHRRMSVRRRVVVRRGDPGCRRAEAGIARHRVTAHHNTFQNHFIADHAGIANRFTRAADGHAGVARFAFVLAQLQATVKRAAELVEQTFFVAAG